MKMKLECKLKLKDHHDKVFIDGSIPGVIAEEVNVFDIDDNLSDAQIKELFTQYRDNMMRRYHQEIFSFFTVELTELK